MRQAVLLMMPLAALTACGGGEPAKNKADKAASLRPGQYEITTEVTDFRKADTGKAKIDTPQGTRTTRNVCVTDPAAAPAALFADEGFTCQTDAGAYVRDGTVNATLACRRQGLNGGINYSVSGSFQAESFEVERIMATSLATDGDVNIRSTARGRRTGDCTAAPAAGNAQGAAKQ